MPTKDAESEGYETIEGTFEINERFSLTTGILKYIGQEKPPKETDYNGMQYIREDVVAKREALLINALAVSNAALIRWNSINIENGGHSCQSLFAAVKVLQEETENALKQEG